MAIAATVPQLITISTTHALSPPSSSSPATVYCFSPLRFIHHRSYIRHCAKPRFTVCNRHVKGRGEPEEIADSFFYDNDELVDDDSDDEEESESSLDLLFRFFNSMFKKVSKRARKASRTLLPNVIPPDLVSFAVDGVLLLASFSVLKALLEVVCSLGSTVFVAILVIRVIFAAISYFQLNGNDSNQTSSYSRTQPVT